MRFLNKDTHKDLFGIYCITNVVTGEKYIGQTSQTFSKRFLHHCWKLRDNSHDNKNLQDSFNEYGTDSFTFSVLEICSDEKILDEREIYYIEHTSNLFNILGGGGGRLGCKMKESTKKLIGEANKKHMLGTHHSAETIQKMSESRTNQKYTRYKKTTKMTDDLVREAKIKLMHGESITNVSKSLGVKRGNIANLVTNNTWRNIEVEGWSDFLSSRTKGKRLRKEQVDQILSMFQSGESIHQLSIKFDRTEKEISDIIRRHV